MGVVHKATTEWGGPGGGDGVGWKGALIRLDHIPCGGHSTVSPTQAVRCEPWVVNIWGGHMFQNL